MELFAALGLPVRWQVDPETLSEAFRESSKKFHPDRFYNKPPEERLAAMTRTADITEAYRTLKDPITRAGYLLKIAGIKNDDTAVVPDDPLVLMEVMEAREAASELGAKGPQAHDGLMNIFKEFDAKTRALEADIDATFALADQGEDFQKVVDKLRRVVIRHRYYSGTRDEIRRALHRVVPS